MIKRQILDGTNPHAKANGEIPVRGAVRPFADEGQTRPNIFVKIIVLLILATVAGPFVVTLCFVAVLSYSLSYPQEYQMRHALPGVIGPLKDIMYGLVYPAVLGTGLVLLALHIARLNAGVWVIHDSVSSLAVAAGCFYTLSFTALSEGKEERSKLSYRWPAFIVDGIEVALMFCCFYFLGLLSEKETAPDLPFVYGALIVDFIIIQPVWRLVAGIKVFLFFKARVVVTLILLLGGTVSIIYPAKPDLLIHRFVALALVGFVAWYIYLATEFSTISNVPTES